MSDSDGGDMYYDGDDGSEYEYQDDHEYTMHEDDDSDQTGQNHQQQQHQPQYSIGGGGCGASGTGGTISGVEYTQGDVSDNPSKAQILQVYRQLGTVCDVDVDAGFYSATLNIRAGENTVFAQIKFPSGEGNEKFPDVAPTFHLHSCFKRPYELLNIQYNCHPKLLKYHWNMCK